jgi:hypothetical protein
VTWICILTEHRMLVYVWHCTCTQALRFVKLLKSNGSPLGKQCVDSLAPLIKYISQVGLQAYCSH